VVREQATGIDDDQPTAIAAYIEALCNTRSAPTVKQHLAAIRMLFDWLVTGHIVSVNPAWSVRGPRHVVKKGKTPVLTAAEPANSSTASTRPRRSAFAIAP